jgi:dinuclear metal center YbgI/SA1388 family protein
MPMPISRILEVLESRAPAQTAESWDNVGLLVGDPAWKTAGAVISIDLTQEAIRAARSQGWKLIITHHPCIFPKSKGLSRVTASPGSGSLVLEAARYGIGVIASHTNFDQCALEVVQSVSQGLGLEAKGRLLEKSSDSLIKVIVFVPSTHLDLVRAAICEAGAGQIGNYDFCTFSSPGTGTFRGGKNTRPFIGKSGVLERADEARLETIVPRGLLKHVLKAMLNAHPYEEVAYDLVAVEQEPLGKGLVKGLGYGFWGEFPRPKSFSEVSRSVKSLFNIHGLWVTDPVPSRIRRVAFVAGKGASFVGAAMAAGCDLFITGEAGYHVALDGARRGVAVMELGHRESERFFLSTMRGWVAAEGLRAKVMDRPIQRIMSL